MISSCWLCRLIWLLQAQDEELDLLDEALFLLRPDDDNAAASRSKQQSTEQELLDNYLEGVLPGGWGEGAVLQRGFTALHSLLVAALQCRPMLPPHIAVPARHHAPCCYS